MQMSSEMTRMVLISHSVAVQISRRKHVCEIFSSLLQIFSEIPAIQHNLKTTTASWENKERGVSFWWQTKQW